MPTFSFVLIISVSVVYRLFIVNIDVPNLVLFCLLTKYQNLYCRQKYKFDSSYMCVRKYVFRKITLRFWCVVSMIIFTICAVNLSYMHTRHFRFYTNTSQNIFTINCTKTEETIFNF